MYKDYLYYNPLRAQEISRLLLILHNHMITNIGVHKRTLRTGNRSGYLEGGLIMSSRVCKNAIPVYAAYSLLSSDHLETAERYSPKREGR